MVVLHAVIFVGLKKVKFFLIDLERCQCRRAENLSELCDEMDQFVVDFIF